MLVARHDDDDDVYGSIPWGLYSCFRIFLGIYIGVKERNRKNRNTDLYDLNFVENEE